MTLLSVLCFLAVFLLIAGGAMWLVNKKMVQFGCLPDWSVASLIGSGACFGIWMHGLEPGVSLVLLSAMLFIGAGFFARGMIRFADGREHAVLNRAARWQYPITVLLATVHILWAGTAADIPMALFLALAWPRLA